jgi:hypothetical protein
MSVAQYRDTETGRSGQLDLHTGELRDDYGKVLARFVPTNDNGLCAALADYAAHYHRKLQRWQLGVAASEASRLATMSGLGPGWMNQPQRSVAMDLAQADVHIDSALPNYAAGYRLQAGVADLAAPVVMAPKASDQYFSWDKDDAFQRPATTRAAPGADVGEVNPRLSEDKYATIEHALGSFIPAEVEANADSPLRPAQAAIRRVMNALMIEREFRVQSLLRNPSSWDPSLVQPLAANQAWNASGGDPIRDIHKAIEKSAMDVTGIILPELVLHAFQRSGAVQKFLAYKRNDKGLPAAGELSALLELPPLYIARMKFKDPKGELSYVWGGDCVLLHQPPENPPTSQDEIATAYTFRWNGAGARDGTISGGFLVRTYWDPRGGRGGTRVVVVHNDAEVMTSRFVGGLIQGAVQ